MMTNYQYMPPVASSSILFEEHKISRPGTSMSIDKDDQTNKLESALLRRMKWYKMPKIDNRLR